MENMIDSIDFLASIPIPSRASVVESVGRDNLRPQGPDSRVPCDAELVPMSTQTCCDGLGVWRRSTDRPFRAAVLCFWWAMERIKGKVAVGHARNLYRETRTGLWF